MTKSKDQLKVFRLIDALTFGLIAFVSNLILVYFMFNANNMDTQGIVMLSFISLMFWFPYVMFVLSRAKWIKKIDFITNHGLPVITNGFPVKKEDLERITEETIYKWDLAANWSKSGEAIQTLFVEFKPFPVTERSMIGRKFAGLLKNKWAVIGFKEPIESTAFSHELGHEIHFAITGYYDNELCHTFMQKHQLS